MRKSLLLLLLLLGFISQDVTAQCSDAGACVIGAAPTNSRHQVALRYVYGQSGGDEDLTFHTIQLDALVDLFENSALIVRLPYRTIDGPLGSTSGIGDLILLWRQRVWQEHQQQLFLQAGGKLATGPVNEDNLPQAYQPGLGTNDLILGASYEYAEWLFAIGYQLSTGRSDNRIDRLERSDDFIGRVGYSSFISDIGFGLEVIAIKRLGESSRQFPFVVNQDIFYNVEDSDQLQVNVLGTASYDLNESYALLGQVALPLLQRDVNFDGLKRALTLSVGARATF
ncbi:hypothetical protein KQI65_05265 [bacterium]|nr:hypothetical protein [bacterium]